ncbi:MAG: exo-alpha-sialidase [Anaerolineae bacterium]|nr:exo-alpha-sialidase [Anaerolineae bacterium]
MRRLFTRLLLVAAFLAPATAALPVHIRAQGAPGPWSTPVNLSQSGAASAPVLIVQPDGTLRVFWWDRFEGVMFADGALAADPSNEKTWSPPRPAPIAVVETVETAAQTETVRTPIEAMPRIQGDATGQAHAFWLSEPDQETGANAVLHSHLSPGSVDWSSPDRIAGAAANFDVTNDLSDTLHLIFVRPVQGEEAPAGLYHRSSKDGGRTWSAPQAIVQSRYLRLLPTGEEHARVTAGTRGSLFVAWDDPQGKGVLVSYSHDGGATWEEPRPLDAVEGHPDDNRPLAVPRDPNKVSWQATDVAGGTVVVSATDEGIMLARWGENLWPEIRIERFDVDAIDSARAAWGQIGLAVVPSVAEQTGGKTLLAAAGIDQSGDVWITSSSTETLEQGFVRSATPEVGQTEPPQPVNLSRSGTASDPAVVAVQGDTLLAFWWDRFDGLMMADGVVVASTVFSGTQEISSSREIWSEPRAVPLPATTPPRIVADLAGRVHAFWLVEPEGREADEREMVAGPLMHSLLRAGSTVWSEPSPLSTKSLAFEVTVDTAGTLHLAYLGNADNSSLPASVYYRRWEQASGTWTDPTTLYSSRYLRLLVPEESHVHLAVDDRDSVYITWDDPWQDRLLLTHSDDGGATWSEPMTVGSSEERPRRGRLVAVPGGEMLLLWERTGIGGPCNLAQASVSEVLDGSPVTVRPILEDLAACPENEVFVPLGEGKVLMVAGSGMDTLTLAVWQGPSGDDEEGAGRWSTLSRLGYSFEDPELAQDVYLGRLQAAVVALQVEMGDLRANAALVTVGVDQNGDAWATPSGMGGLAIVFAPLPAWSTPANVSQGEAHRDLPAVATDTEGQVHVVWNQDLSADEPAAGLMYARWDSETWTPPAQVLRSPEGGVWGPDLSAGADRLHAVWSSQDGEIVYSSAFADEASRAGAWSEPRLLSEAGTFATSPDIVVDLAGGLQVVYAVAVNEGRGIYYTRSADGESWMPPCQVFDARAAGWVAAGQPYLDVDRYGFLHVAWMKSPLLGSGVPEGVYYARSLDGGETWSEALDVAVGRYGWPQVVAAGEGQVHLVWQEVNGEDTWWHALSPDAGQSWTRPQRVAGFGDVGAPARLMADANGALHLVGVGGDGEKVPSLRHVTWDGVQWSSPDAFRLDVAAVGSGIGASIVPARRQLDVIFRGTMDTGEEVQVDVWHTGRFVPTVAVTPAPDFVPQPTATPTSTALPTATARPTASFSTAPPAGEGNTGLLFPILLAGGGALLAIGALVGTKIFLTGRR